MLVYLFSAVFAVAPVLQAVFDLRLQLAFQQVVLLACASWFFLRLYGDGVPAGLSSKKFYPLWGAAALSLLSLALSPLRGCIFNEWGNYGAGLLIFAFSSYLGPQERRTADGAVLGGAWLVIGLSIFQAFALKNFTVSPPLTNLNALALYAVMIVPLALERGQWPLAAAMAALVVWTQSLGAALAGLAAAGVYGFSRLKAGGSSGRRMAPAGFAALCALAFFFSRADSIAGRLAWWGSAWDMFLARPLAGFGYASFARVQAAFQPAGVFREHAIYAHNYYLEFLAENGFPAAVLWFFTVYAAVRAKRGLVRYSLIAALAHSVIDFGLSVPANFWIFCYLLSSPAREEQPLRIGRRAAAAALVFAAAIFAALGGLNFSSLSFEMAERRALAAAGKSGLPSAEYELRGALGSALFRGQALEFLGGISSRVPGQDRRAARYYEGALLENRYSARAWFALKKIYAAPGSEMAAAGLARRRAEVFK